MVACVLDFNNYLWKSTKVVHVIVVWCDEVVGVVSNLSLIWLLVVIEELVQEEDLAFGSGSSCHYFMEIAIDDKTSVIESSLVFHFIVVIIELG